MDGTDPLEKNRTMDISDVKNMNSSIVNGTSYSPLCDLNDFCEPIVDYVDRLEEYAYPTNAEWVLVAAYILTFIVGVVGNILVCFAIVRNRNMRTTVYIFIMNLSIADLGVIIICLPLALTYDVTNTWFFGTAGCYIHTFFSTISINVSVLTLSAISIERWYAICHPLRFHSTIGRAKIIIAIIWIVSACASLPITVTSTSTRHQPYTIYFADCYPRLIPADTLVVYQLCVITIFYFIPLGLMAFAYIQIACVLWRNQAPRRNVSQRNRRSMLSVSSNSSERGTNNNESRKKAARMLIAVVIVFAICYLPNHTLNIAVFTGSLENVLSNETITMIAMFAHWFVFFNSCVNPIIYNFMSSKFRQEFKDALFLCCAACRKHRWNESYRMTFNTVNYRTISIRTANMSNRRERTDSTKQVVAQV